MQAERIRRQRTSGDRRVALQEREVTITVDRVLRGTSRVPRNKAIGPADRLVTEMLQCLPTETAYEVTHWFDKRFKGECRAPEAWKVLPFVSLKKPDAKLGKGFRGFRAIALLSVFSKWYTTVLVDMLHSGKEPSEWKRLHVGAERRINCEHMQALVTNMFQRRWEWQEDRRVDLQPRRYNYNTVFRGKPGCQDGIQRGQAPSGIKDAPLKGVHGHLTVTLLVEMQDVWGSACFQISETEFRYSRCIRQGGVEALVLWGCVA